MNSEEMSGQSVVITGANRGIGLAFVRAYRARGATVYGVCRTTTPELEASGAIVVEGVDVTSGESMVTLQQRFEGVAVAVLINNAGLLESETLDKLNFDTITRQFEVNAMGPLRVTAALLPSMSRGSKVGLITSRMGSITDNGSGGYYGYRMSKAALNAAGMSLAKDLHSTGIAVAILHPGFVQTGMVGFAGDISSETAANRLVARMDELSLDNSGTFWHSSGELLPW
ncbi:SDR family oxidoreductase [Teredinibacter purpureus]|uniref:SDR family oxidoreductase n=1 Tax=Teredinibacter purpureus TaxID=2731756 RepID=UPI0005F8547C|nr:SDR family oxidoreductase [Teredinibacter purpureus]